MAGSRRVYQVAERIKELVAAHLIHTADPRFSLVTITSVMVSPDLRQAKVYWVVSFPSNTDRDARIAEVDEAFQNAEGLFRRMLSKELGIRFVPALRFYYDDTLDTVEQVERLMGRIKPSENPDT
jgi:ribosome-binding factor A